MDAHRTSVSSDTATDPTGGTGGTGTGPAGALLTPRLCAAATDFLARLGAVRSRTTGSELRRHDLVHDRDVRLDAEDVGERRPKPVNLARTAGR